MAKAPKMVKIVLGFEISEADAKFFLGSAIERVINTSVNIIESFDKGEKSADLREPIDVNWEDWQEWKPLVVGMWSAVHNELFCEHNKIEGGKTFYFLRKGDL